MVTTMTACKGCGGSMMAIDKNGKPVCTTCAGLSPDSSIPIEVEMPDTWKCSQCGKETTTEALLRRWVVIPFANATRGTYYDGCRGWD